MYKKSLGQNFLRSEKALAQIVEAGEIKSSDTILEIGPGQGALTEKLLERAGKVIAVEKDRELVTYLKEKFKKEIENKKLILINEDILNVPVTFYFPLSTTYKLIANIPYNITGEIFRKFLQKEKLKPERMVLLVQKEVAERIIARDGKESVLSISVKVYGEPKYIDTVKRGSFVPAPNVDSAILLIENISRKSFHPSGLKASSPSQGSIISEENFFKLLKAGFAHKRKLLKSNLAQKPPLPPASPPYQGEKIAPSLIREGGRGVGFDVEQVFQNCGIPEKARAEELKVEDWLCLAQTKMYN